MQDKHFPQAPKYGNEMFRRQKKARRLPTLPRKRSTIGVGGLDFRVRDGNGYGTSAMATGPEDPPGAPRTIRAPANRPILADRRTGPTRQYGQASRLISTGRLHVLPRLDLRPIDQVFSLVPSVPSGGRGCLISGRASRLDAFSGYPFRTWLPSDCRWHDNWHTRGSSTSVLSY